MIPIISLIINTTLIILGSLVVFIASATAQVFNLNDPKMSASAIRFVDQHPGDHLTTKETIDYLNGGFPPSWNQQFELIDKKKSRTFLNPTKNYIFLFATEPTHVFDLRSGENLRASLTKQVPGLKTQVGHEFLGWQCSNGKTVTHQAVMTVSGESNKQLYKMVMNNWGLTPYISVFTDGIFQAGAHFEDKIQTKYLPKQTPFQFLILEVKSDQCQKVKSFAVAYATHPNRPYRIFGTPPSPARMEGAGCLSFVDAALNHANILNEVRAHFVRRLKIPFHVLGRGEVNSEGQPAEIKDVFVHPEILKNTKGKISLDNLFSKNWDTKPGEPYYVMDQIDPELVHLSFRLFHEQAIGLLDARGIHFSKDNPQVTKLLTRTRKILSIKEKINPFSQHDLAGREEVIQPGYDRDFGNQSAQISTEVQKYFSENQATMGVEYFNFLYGYGLKLEFSNINN